MKGTKIPINCFIIKNALLIKMQHLAKASQYGDTGFALLFRLIAF